MRKNILSIGFLFMVTNSYSQWTTYYTGSYTQHDVSAINVGQKTVFNSKDI